MAVPKILKRATEVSPAESELIYAFMNGKWKALSRVSGVSHEDAGKKFKSKEACIKFCDKENEIVRKTNRYKALPENLQQKQLWRPYPVFYGYFQNDFKYKTSFDALIPVWIKIKNLLMNGTNKMPYRWWYSDTSQAILNGNISRAFDEIVLGIKWASEQGYHISVPTKTKTVAIKNLGKTKLSSSQIQVIALMQQGYVPYEYWHNDHASCFLKRDDKKGVVVRFSTLNALKEKGIIKTKKEGFNSYIYTLTKLGESCPKL